MSGRREWEGKTKKAPVLRAFHSPISRDLGAGLRGKKFVDTMH